MKTFIRCYFILVFMCLFLIVQVCMAVDDSLVLHFTFDEGAGNVVTDDSIYLNNGKFKANPKWVDGKFGKALSFNAGDSVEIPGSDSLDITKAITMEMWVKITGGAEVKQSGIERGGWEVGEYSIYPVYEGGTVIQFFDLPPACGDAGIKGPSIQDGEWHYFTGTWDGINISLYIDGELGKSGGCDGTLKSSNTSVYIGSRNGGERFLTGIVDEVRIYNRALTQAEVKKDMNTFGVISVN
ncbi:MAG: large repetitive protein, partial [Candidatus Poribacteria bacterium]|nr:large repetitive protein [Candidatus Poribacteria bacterium]